MPRYSKEEQDKLFREHRPGRPPRPKTKEHEELAKFIEDIEVILQVVDEHEYQAAVTFLERPSETFKKSVVFPSAGSAVGFFAERRVALIHTDKGANISEYIEGALGTFKNAKYIVGVGSGYAFDRTKYKFGDVLVSRKIGDLRNWRIERDGNVINRGQLIDAVKRLQELFCMDASFEDDFEVATGRYSKTYVGTFASSAVALQNREMRDKFAQAVPEVIGGEMEGGQLMWFQQKRRIDGVIVVKGVADYGDGLSTDEWKFTAAMAAFTYVRDKMYYYT